jgi:hypothetical protein
MTEQWNREVPMWAKVAKVIALLVLGTLVLAALAFGTCLLVFAL